MFKYGGKKLKIKIEIRDIYSLHKNKKQDKIRLEKA